MAMNGCDHRHILKTPTFFSFQNECVAIGYHNNSNDDKDHRDLNQEEIKMYQSINQSFVYGYNGANCKYK
ncbi:hypothetical protein DERF_001342 [Dermatophagoides farinae]|uniref:Uncharacterized protein n=1 Tax=Dermatophagoides farinae TaxID=6954 RepID=A0A922LCY6_DERFA|nr:hypothetical protein DERF_001342 [Dermatophagoides farinae]